MEDVIYFEVNNWFPGINYPNNKRFINWLSNDFNIIFNNENWVKENKLCVVRTLIDMSTNFCITAKKQWVEDNCPELLTEYTQFLRQPNNDGEVYSEFGMTFLKYCDENIGITDEEYD